MYQVSSVPTRYVQRAPRQSLPDEPMASREAHLDLDRNGEHDHRTHRLNIDLTSGLLKRSPRQA
jgi:hypothetical protein